MCCNLKHYAVKFAFTKPFWVLTRVSQMAAVSTFLPSVINSIISFMLNLNFTSGNSLFVSLLDFYLYYHFPLSITSFIICHDYDWETGKQHNTLSCLCELKNWCAPVIHTLTRDLHIEELAAKSILYLHI